MNKWLILIALLGSTTAFAKRGSNRQGIYFGSQLRLISEDQTLSNADGSTTQTTSSLAVSPFVGYAIAEILGLGISFTGESTSIVEDYKPSDGSPNQITETRGSLKGTSLFTKLLFARVCFMEAGLGVYQGSVTRTTTTQSGTDSFSGSSQSKTNSGVGYGYHFGGGLEIPMGVGFFFSSAFYWRQVKMTDYVDKSTEINLGNEKNEIQFGIIHYLQ